jgi:hypothetical protein
MKRLVSKTADDHMVIKAPEPKCGELVAKNLEKNFDSRPSRDQRRGKPRQIESQRHMARNGSGLQSEELKGQVQEIEGRPRIPAGNEVIAEAHIAEAERKSSTYAYDHPTVPSSGPLFFLHRHSMPKRFDGLPQFPLHLLPTTLLTGDCISKAAERCFSTTPDDSIPPISLIATPHVIPETGWLTARFVRGFQGWGEDPFASLDFLNHQSALLGSECIVHHFRLTVSSTSGKCRNAMSLM